MPLSCKNKQNKGSSGKRVENHKLFSPVDLVFWSHGCWVWTLRVVVCLSCRGTVWASIKGGLRGSGSLWYTCCSRIILRESSTWEDLRARVQVCTAVARHSQRLAFDGPGSSPCPFTSGSLVTSLGLRHGCSCPKGVAKGSSPNNELHVLPQVNKPGPHTPLLLPWSLVLSGLFLPGSLPGNLSRVGLTQGPPVSS